MSEEKETTSPDVPEKTGPKGLSPYGHPMPKSPGKTGKRQRTLSQLVRGMITSRKLLDLDPVRGYNKLEKIVDNLARIASSPKSPQAVAAATLLFDRAYGKAAPSTEELDAIKEGGFRIMLVAAPPVDGIEMEQVAAKPEPKFITGEVVDE